MLSGIPRVYRLRGTPLAYMVVKTRIISGISKFKYPPKN
jgi:hypothetical protein